MTYTLQTTSPATTEPFRLADLAGWLRADEDLERDRILAAMAGAKQFVESVTGQRFGSQSVKVWLQNFPCSRWTFPIAPVVSVDSIKYYNIADAEATVPGSSYYVVSDEEQPYLTRIVLKDGRSWPTVSLRPVKGIEITIQCGHVTPPALLGIAYRQLVAHYFQNPSATVVVERAQASAVEIPHGAMAILNQFRIY